MGESRDLRLPLASANSDHTRDAGAVGIAPDASPETDPSRPHPHETRTGDCPGCASLRSQNRYLSDLLVEEADALHAVREYALECSSRAGAQIDAATVAASLWPLLSGLPIPVRPCPQCVARKEADRRHAAFLTGLADLQRCG